MSKFKIVSILVLFGCIVIADIAIVNKAITQIEINTVIKGTIGVGKGLDKRKRYSCQIKVVGQKQNIYNYDYYLEWVISEKNNPNEKNLKAQSEKKFYRDYFIMTLFNGQLTGHSTLNVRTSSHAPATLQVFKDSTNNERYKAIYYNEMFLGKYMVCDGMKVLGF